MKVYFLLLGLLLLLSCAHKQNHESLYLYFHGDRDISFYDLVLKNDSNSYSENLMYVAEPIEILLDDYELQNIKNGFASDYFFTNAPSYSKGVFIIHYLNGERKKDYLLFNKKGISDLVINVDKHIKNAQTKKRIIDWILTIQK